MHVHTVLIAMCVFAVFVRSAEARCDNPRDCLSGEAPETFASEPWKTRCERMLFVTPDEVARYLFLTNARDDGDRSVAIYRSVGRSGSLSGAYWLTTTEASDSLGGESTRHIKVRRYDAPIPPSTAQSIHRLWIMVLEASREPNLGTMMCGPSGIFFATSGERRLTARVVSLEEGCLCLDLLNLGEELVEYPKLPPPKRANAARHIEQTSHAIFQRVWRAKDA